MLVAFLSVPLKLLRRLEFVLPFIPATLLFKVLQFWTRPVERDPSIVIEDVPVLRFEESSSEKMIGNNLQKVIAVFEL